MINEIQNNMVYAIVGLSNVLSLAFVKNKVDFNNNLQISHDDLINNKL
jgi:hypothetical protein